MSVPPLKIADLAAGYGKRTVIRDIAFTVEPGEVFGLIGLNGVGKTTLIKALLGLSRASGTADIFGLPAGPPKGRRLLAYLPEKFQPSPLLRGWEFLSLTLGYYGKVLDRNAATRLCEGLDLDPAALGRQGRTYSKGMGQKLGLLGTLLTGLPLLILDEPMSGLDPRARIMLKDRLKEYSVDGNAIFFSSHILADIEEMCDRIAVMCDGRLIYVGPPGDLMARHGGQNLERAFLAAIDAVAR
ncbi:ABC transporter ATP-binding protein [Telmatospirillum siberiense]|uniref:ABC transporter ATP-binding protein n=1 Tax=Telmatospirillum siberiense TaxID=382514 RepID=UPI0018EB7C1F|nr:ABC transporter ATP-binding protein [Telmatospirillum siberiense]